MKTKKRHMRSQHEKREILEEVRGGHVNPAGQPDIENSEKTLDGEGAAAPRRHKIDERQ